MFDGLSDREKAQKTLHIIWGNRWREDCAGGASSEERVAEAGFVKNARSASSSWGWTLFGSKAKEKADVDVDM